MVARIGETIVGAACLNALVAPSGVKVHLDDVIVDPEYRRYGIGDALMNETIAWSTHRGASEINFTSNGSRQAAHRLYFRHGATKLDTVAFRIELPNDW